MEIRYTGDIEEQIVTPAGKPAQVVTRNEWVEVDDDVGAQLVEQGWETKTKASRAKSEKE
jgi:hypothetical protein